MPATWTVFVVGGLEGVGEWVADYLGEAWDGVAEGKLVLWGFLCDIATLAEEYGTDDPDEVLMEGEFDGILLVSPESGRVFLVDGGSLIECRAQLTDLNLRLA